MIDTVRIWLVYTDVSNPYEFRLFFDKDDAVNFVARKGGWAKIESKLVT